MRAPETDAPMSCSTILLFAELMLTGARRRATAARGLWRLGEIFLDWRVRDFARAVVEFLRLVRGCLAQLDGSRIFG
jgi:hypothetical protein